jgi:integrase
MASVFKRNYTANDGTIFKPKKWTIKYKNEFGEFVSIAGFKDKAASLAYGNQLERQAERKRAGLPVYETTDPHSIDAAIDAYCAELERLGRSKSHVYNERGFMTRLAKACDWKYLEQIRQEQLTGFLADLQAAGKSPRTQNAYRDCAVTFCNWCVRNKLLAENPLIRVPKAKINGRRPRRRRALTLAEFQALGQLPARRALVYQVAGLSGLRHEELALLARRDFTLGERPQWHLREDICKGKRCDRVPMLPECAAVLSAHCQDMKPTDRVFASVPIPRTFNRDLKRAGIVKRDEQGRQIDFHSLRYFYCTLTGSKLPIQVVKLLMRHRDIRTTCNLYMDLGLEDVNGRS